jgi:hypothetical protein
MKTSSPDTGEEKNGEGADYSAARLLTGWRTSLR